MAKLSNILTARSSQGPSDNFKNLIINGAMQVAQRGTSVASITTSGYNTADRYRVAIATLGTWTQSVENDAPTGSGFRKSLKMLCTTADASPAAGDEVSISQNIEGQNLQHIKKGTSSAEQLTLSFWVKSNITGTYVVNIADIDNSREVSKSYTISASATWEYKTIIFPADTTGLLDNDNALSLSLSFGLGAGSNYTSGTLQQTWATNTTANRFVGQTNLASATNNYWQITGVQLEVGDTATPFEFKPLAQDLQECERYYQIAQGAIMATGNSFTTSCGTSFTFKTQMRTSPTVSISGALAVTRYGTSDHFQSSGIVSISAGGVRVTNNSISLNCDNFTGLPLNTPLPVLSTSTDGKFLLSAEL